MGLGQGGVEAEAVAERRRELAWFNRDNLKNGPFQAGLGILRMGDGVTVTLTFSLYIFITNKCK